METDELTKKIIDAAFHIHKEIGPGLLESVYETILAHEIEKGGLFVERQKNVSFEYDGIFFEDGLRIDLLVEQSIVVELKSVERIAPVHFKQVLTYLRLMHLPVGLLINFGAPLLKEGLHRVVNNFVPTANSPLRINRTT